VTKRSRLFKFAIVSLILFAGWILFAPVLAELLIVEKPLPRADAIFVLGGSATYVERTQKAVALYKQGVATRILLSDDGRQGGWSRLQQRNPPYVDLAKRELIAQGVSPESIEILQPQVTGTIYEAQNLRRKLEEEKWNSVLLVTSAYHSRRALWTFERILADNKTEIGLESPQPGVQTPFPFSWWLSPLGWDVVAGEYVKSAYYRARY
jgi:uncharacterized SAM-binding protein YcdF (DUF218 family)